MVVVVSADFNPRRRVEASRVIYRGVQSAHDNAVLQCVATNDHGSILANAALKVMGTLSLYLNSTTRTRPDPHGLFCGPGLRETPLGPCGSPTKSVRVRVGPVGSGRVRSGPCSGI